MKIITFNKHDLIRLAKIKPETRYILAELVTYVYLREYVECKNIEKPPVFDFKCNDKYYEVKYNHASLSNEQLVMAYKLLKRKRKLYLVTNKSLPNKDPVDVFYSFIDVFYVYEITINDIPIKYIKKMIRLERTQEKKASEILRVMI